MKERGVLVIGGNGFIGEYLVSEFKHRGVKVSVFGRQSVIPIDEAVKGVSAVAFLTQPNKELLKDTLFAIKKFNIQAFLYTSSVLIYEGGKTPQGENDKLLPLTEYSKNKKEEEDLILSFQKENPSINIIIARLGNVYGGIKNKGLIGLIFEQISGKRKEEIILSGKGDQVRDFIFIDDVVRALSLLILNIKESCIVNVTTGTGTTLLQLVKKLERVTQKRVLYKFGPKLQEANSIIGDNARLNLLVGLSPQISLEEGLRKAYERCIMNSYK